MRLLTGIVIIAVAGAVGFVAMNSLANKCTILTPWNCLPWTAEDNNITWR